MQLTSQAGGQEAGQRWERLDPKITWSQRPKCRDRRGKLSEDRAETEAWRSIAVEPVAVRRVRGLPWE